MNLNDLFNLSFVDRKDEVGLEWAGAEFTFGEINARGERMARALRQRGVLQGDRLCVYLANRIEMIDLYLACVRLGVIFVPVNILYR
jgi:malonyl-CoA/methylmalonyl-CoA synthetase